MEYEHHGRVEDSRAIADAVGPDEDAAGDASRFHSGASKAKELGDTGLVSLTVDVPKAIVDYLTEKDVLQRQELVTRAFQLLVVELESGQDLIDL